MERDASATSSVYKRVNKSRKAVQRASKAIAVSHSPVRYTDPLTVLFTFVSQAASPLRYLASVCVPLCLGQLKRQSVRARAIQRAKCPGGASEGELVARGPPAREQSATASSELFSAPSAGLQRTKRGSFHRMLWPQAMHFLRRTQPCRRPNPTNISHRRSKAMPRGPPCGGLSAGWQSAWSTLVPRGPSGRTARRRGAASLSSAAASPVGLGRSCLAARLGHGRHACQGSEGSGSVASRRSPP